MINYQSQIETLKNKIRTLRKVRRDETRRERDERFTHALKKLQEIGLEVTTTGGRFRHIYPDGISHEYPLSKVTYDPAKDVFFICGGIVGRRYDSKTDSYYDCNKFYSDKKNSIKPSSDRIRELKLGTLEDLLTKAEAAKRDLSALDKGEKLGVISPAVAIQMIRQRKEKGLRTGYRESSLKYSSMDKIIDEMIKYGEFGARKILCDDDLTTPYEPVRRIVFFPRLDVYLDFIAGKNTIYLYGEKNLAKKVIRKIRYNDDIHAPGGF